MKDSICFSNNNSIDDASNRRNDNNENTKAEKKNIAECYKYFIDAFNGRFDAWLRAEPMLEESYCDYRR